MWHRSGHIEVWRGIGLNIAELTLYIIRGNGASLMLYCNGRTPWQCSQGYLVRATVIMLSFTSGILVAVSFSTQSNGQCCTVQWRGNMSSPLVGPFFRLLAIAVVGSQQCTLNTSVHGGKEKQFAPRLFTAQHGMPAYIQWWHIPERSLIVSIKYHKIPKSVCA